MIQRNQQRRTFILVSNLVHHNQPESHVALLFLPWSSRNSCFTALIVKPWNSGWSRSTVGWLMANFYCSRNVLIRNLEHPALRLQIIVDLHIPFLLEFRAYLKPLIFIYSAIKHHISSAISFPLIGRYVAGRLDV